MPSYARCEILADDAVGVYHCMGRWVRRAFLCGVELVSQKSHNRRKQWIRDRLHKLASLFGIDVCVYAVMRTHLHVILRVRPDLVQDRIEREVALRWLQLFGPRDHATGRAAEPEEHDLRMITSNPERVAELRCRLGSLSCFMRCLSEPIARGGPGPALLADVVVAKHDDHVPLYRQSELYARDDLELDCSTFAAG
jgi:Transposase IS66 family